MSYLITNARIFDGTGRAQKLGGEIMGRPGELGVVAPGALADLLRVNGDLLADSGIPQGPTALRMIMKDGALHRAP
jgi:imidazolonepropionase-like amidohydrolase